MRDELAAAMWKAVPQYTGAQPIPDEVYATLADAVVEFLGTRTGVDDEQIRAAIDDPDASGLDYDEWQNKRIAAIRTLIAEAVAPLHARIERHSMWLAEAKHERNEAQVERDAALARIAELNRIVGICDANVAVAEGEREAAEARIAELEATSDSRMNMARLLADQVSAAEGEREAAEAEAAKWQAVNRNLLDDLSAAQARNEILEAEKRALIAQVGAQFQRINYLEERY